MRFKITFKIPGNNPLLPINYQYPLSSWIYRIIQHANPEFSAWLHSNGYQMGNKKFKNFTFSRLHFPSFKIRGDRIEIHSGHITLIISFAIDEAAENFIQGIFQNQDATIGDIKSKTNFRVETIERLHDPVFTPSMSLKLLSPIVISRPAEQPNGKLIPDYLHPSDPDFERIFFDSLIKRYMTSKYFQLHHSMAGHSNEFVANSLFKLEVTGKPRSNLITIKAFTPQETKVKGYIFHFTIHAPAELIEFGYHAGFGEKGSLGFGAVSSEQ